MRDFNITRSDAESFMRTMVIYTHGLATLAATHGLKCSKVEAHAQIRECGIRFLQSLQVSESQILKLEEDL